MQKSAESSPLCQRSLCVNRLRDSPSNLMMKNRRSRGLSPSEFRVTATAGAVRGTTTTYAGIQCVYQSDMIVVLVCQLTLAGCPHIEV